MRRDLRGHGAVYFGRFTGNGVGAKAFAGGLQMCGEKGELGNNSHFRYVEKAPENGVNN
jgi:hypothetical protein